MTYGTPAQKPSEQPSKEGDEKGLKLAQKQGEALGETIGYMINEKAQTGGKKAAGEYIVGYAVEKAEGLYHLQDGQLVWQEPKEENIHIEIVICDGADMRFLPYLNVQVMLIDADGREIGTRRQPFLWHPYLYHYGRNWKIPGDGAYTIRVRIEPPDFPRHDKVNGKRYSKPVEVKFAGVEMKTGKG